MAEQSRRRTQIISLANQKGGVGKTTTAINLAAGLAEQGCRVLVVDLDPQGNASTGLGIMAADRKATTYDLLLDAVPLDQVAIPTQIENLLIAPATTDLSSADLEIVGKDRRSYLLYDALHGVAVDKLQLDYILIDCPPALGLLTINALVAADSILVPLQAEFFALEGLSQLLLTVRQVRQTANPDLRIEGVVLTMYDHRNNLAQQVLADAKETLGEIVFNTIVPRNVRISEAPSHAVPVLTYDPTSKGAMAYRSLAREILDR